DPQLHATVDSDESDAVEFPGCHQPAVLLGCGEEQRDRRHRRGRAVGHARVPRGARAGEVPFLRAERVHRSDPRRADGAARRSDHPALHPHVAPAPGRQADRRDRDVPDVRPAVHGLDDARLPARHSQGSRGGRDGGRRDPLRRIRPDSPTSRRPRSRRNVDLRLYSGLERVHHCLRVPPHTGEADPDGLARLVHDAARNGLGPPDGGCDALRYPGGRVLPARPAADRIRAHFRGGARVMAQIELVHLSKVYSGDVIAVRDLNLEVEEGEFVVLVGPSGCGKTTALRMIAGLEEISSGEIRIGGKVVNDLAPRDRDIAMVFQTYALYPHKTVYDNLAFGLRMRKVPKEEQKRRVEEIARVLGLGDMLQRRPAQLSGGQRQRVAMGRAIVREPKAFLMDEPLSNLDAKLRVQMRAEIARIQQALKVTTVYVTHDQVEAMTMGNRVAVMRDGRLQQVDTPQRLYDAPVNLFVASFVGSPAMNLFEAGL